MRTLQIIAFAALSIATTVLAVIGICTVLQRWGWLGQPHTTMATITVTIADTPHGMRIATTACKPAAGQPLTPAESWTVDLLRLCNRGSVEITYGCLDIHAQALSEFAQRLLSPDDLGHAVTGEVRRCAQEALGRNTPIATPFPPLEAA